MEIRAVRHLERIPIRLTYHVIARLDRAIQYPTVGGY